MTVITRDDLTWENMSLLRNRELKEIYKHYKVK